MTVTIEREYAAPLELLWSTLRSRAYWLALLKSGSLSGSKLTELASSKGALHVQLEKQVPSKAPKFAQSFVGDTIVMHHSEKWQIEEGVCAGSFVIDLDDSPARMTGEMALRAAGSRTHYSLSLSAEVKVPLLGKRLARMLEAESKSSLAADYIFTSTYLSSFGAEDVRTPSSHSQVPEAPA